MAYNPLFRGKTAKAPSRSVSTGYQNNTISDLLAGSPVTTDGNGNISLVDVSDEDSVSRFVGITTELIQTSSSGQVANIGRAESLASALTSFALGDALYVGKNGTLINVRPNIGVASFVADDWIIFLGVIVKNEFNPSERDIQLMINVIGQL